jgi:23S rRNA pseudouridine1911/1915/1917 synthase
MEKITITKEQVGKRVDKFLSLEFFLYSRGEIIRKIKNGEVRVNGKSVKPSHVLEENDVVALENFSKESVEEKLVENKNIPLEIIFQNENFVVINKQAGVQVHPSHNEKKNTLVNAIIARFPEVADVHDDSVSGKLRPGIVHRLDKDTSGVLVIARNTKAFAELKKLFKDRKIEKSYVAICQGIFAEKAGTIEKPIARSSSYRKQVVARKNTKTIVREAVKNLATKLELKKTLHFHIARHSFGVILLESDVDIYKVSKLLGHKSVQTTIKHYANITDKGAREAIDSFPEIKI